MERRNKARGCLSWIIHSELAHSPLSLYLCLLLTSHTVCFPWLNSLMGLVASPSQYTELTVVVIRASLGKVWQNLWLVSDGSIFMIVWFFFHFVIGSIFQPPPHWDNTFRYIYRHTTGLWSMTWKPKMEREIERKKEVKRFVHAQNRWRMKVQAREIKEDWECERERERESWLKCATKSTKSAECKCAR